MGDRDRIIRELQAFRREKRRLHPNIRALAGLGVKAPEIAEHCGLTRQGVDRILRAVRTAPQPETPPKEQS